jgi:hypothetical protein
MRFAGERIVYSGFREKLTHQMVSDPHFGAVLMRLQLLLQGQ